MARDAGRSRVDVLDIENLPGDIARDIAYLRADRDYSRLIDLVLEQVASIAPDRRSKALLHGVDLVEQLMVAANRTAWEAGRLERNHGTAATPYGYWRHIDVAAPEAWRAAPAVRLDDAEGIAADYLQMPFRIPELDRQILDMLLAAHIREAVEAEARDPARGRSKRLSARTMALVAGTGMLWGAVLIAPIATPLAIACGVSSLGISAMAMRAGSRTAQRQRRRMRTAAQALLDAYARLGERNGDPRGIAEQVERAAAGGLSITGLSALTDDILTRRTTV